MNYELYARPANIFYDGKKWGKNGKKDGKKTGKNGKKREKNGKNGKKWGKRGKKGKKFKNKILIFLHGEIVLALQWTKAIVIWTVMGLKH